MSTNKPYGLPSNSNASRIERRNFLKSAGAVAGLAAGSGIHGISSVIAQESNFAESSPFTIPGVKYGTFHHTIPSISKKFTIITPGPDQAVSAKIQSNGWVYNARTEPNQYYVILLTRLDISNGQLIQNDPENAIGLALDSIDFYLAPQRKYSDATFAWHNLDFWRSGAKLMGAVPPTTSNNQLGLELAVPMTVQGSSGGIPTTLNEVIQLSASDIPGGQAFYELTDWEVNKTPLMGGHVGVNWQYNQTVPWNPRTSPLKSYPNGVYPNSNCGSEGGSLPPPSQLGTSEFSVGAISAYVFDGKFVDPPNQNPVYFQYNFSGRWTQWQCSDIAPDVRYIPPGQFYSPAINLYQTAVKTFPS